MYIDGNGDAEGNFTVVALLDDEEVNGSLRMSMQPVGYFQYSPDRVIPVSQLAHAYDLLKHPNTAKAEGLHQKHQYDLRN